MDRLGFGSASDYGMQAPASGGSTMGYGLRGTGGGGATMGYGLDPGSLKNLWDTQLATWGQQLDQTAAQQQAAATGQTGSNAGWGNNAGVTTAGGAWANLDAANNEIAAAAAKYNVPANLIKAMINNESSGDWNRDGSRVTDIGRVDGNGNPDPILPYVGIFRSTADAWGFNFDQMAGNRQMQIDAMAYGLNKLYQQTGSWDGVVTTYFSGHPVPTGWADENGLTDQAYLDKTKQSMAYLDSRGGGGPGSGLVGGGWGGDTSGAYNAANAMSTMFGPTAGVPGWGEFNVPSSNGLYGYGTAYGMNGSNHTGLDVPLDFGSKMYAPMGGTVLCGGTGVGTDEGGGSCSAFNNTMGGSGQGNGRIEIQLDNGAVLIFGHASSAAVAPGQRIAAGTLLGYSGGMNSAHVHLEARVPLGGGAWKIVDPRTVLGAAPGSWTSAGAGAAAGGYAGQPGQPQQAPMSSSQVMMSLLSGQSVPGYGG